MESWQENLHSLYNFKFYYFQSTTIIFKRAASKRAALFLYKEAEIGRKERISLTDLKIRRFTVYSIITSIQP